MNLFKYYTAVSKHSCYAGPVGGLHSNNTRVPDTWPKCSSMAPLARGSSLGQSGWLTNNQIFFRHIVPDGVLSYSEHVCFSTLGNGRTTKYVMPSFILSSHLFFWVLLAIQHVLECSAGEGRKRKRQTLPQMLESITAKLATRWYAGARTELGDLEGGNRLTEEQKGVLCWDPQCRLERNEWKHYKVKE